MGFDFSAFVEECPSPLITVTRDGTIAFANRSVASLIGYGLLELARTSFATIVPARFRPDLSQADWVEHLAERTASQRHLPWALIHRSGVELELEWTVLGGHDAAGHAVAMVVFSPHRGSLTPEPISRAQPSNAEQIHQIIFENAPIGIFHFNERGVVTAANERFVHLIGSSRRQIIGLAMLTLPNADISRSVREALGGKLSNYEGAYTSATGQKTSWVRVVMAPVKNELSQVIGGVGLVDDVSGERAARDLLSRAERLASLGTLAAGVVHEVQNPLAYLKTNLELAVRQLEGSIPIDQLRSELSSALGSAREGAERVAAIVRDLKTFARSDDAIRGPVALRAVIESAEKLTQNHVRHRARLFVELEADATVWASESRLVQLFVNLLLNAADAIPEGAADENRIVVSSHTLADGRVRIEVEDTGRGISR
ncbi:MAG: PAS domain S-box protein, partial [Myxococcales bacterium]|nr:PAS domain S-box protein [Myxococcales bacterium]